MDSRRLASFGSLGHPVGWCSRGKIVAHHVEPPVVLRRLGQTRVPPPDLNLDWSRANDARASGRWRCRPPSPATVVGAAGRREGDLGDPRPSTVPRAPRWVRCRNPICGQVEDMCRVSSAYPPSSTGRRWSARRWPACTLPASLGSSYASKNASPVIIGLSMSVGCDSAGAGSGLGSVNCSVCMRTPSCGRRQGISQRAGTTEQLTVDPGCRPPRSGTCPAAGWWPRWAS